MKTCEENGILVICPEGRIDSSNAGAAEEEIRRILAENPGKDFLFDAEELTGITSAGLRILLMIHKNVKPGFLIRNASPEVYDVLEMTGFSTFLDVRKKLRSISVENCPVIGQGAVGKVYRLDADTIVKVYNMDDCLPMIENEQKRSRQALLKGIPTAIPFDIVKVGDRYGSVFEMIKAGNCNDILVKEPGRLEEITELYAAFLRQVHSVLAEPGEFPDAREEYLRYLASSESILSGDVYRRIEALIQEMPEDLHIVHGDIQLKNVLFSNGEMILIDMETLSCGNPVFDLAGLYVTYIAFGEDDPGNSRSFLGLPAETCEKLFFGTIRRYLNTEDEQALQADLDRIRLLGYVRFLSVLDFLNGDKPEYYEQRIRHSREHLEELSARVKKLSV